MTDVCLQFRFKSLPRLPYLFKRFLSSHLKQTRRGREGTKEGKGEGGKKGNKERKKKKREGGRKKERNRESE